jgi:glycosyltransferase involved in cell wall biosynthesis
MKIAYDFQAFSQRYGGVALYFSKLAAHIGSSLAQTRVFAPIFQNRYVHSLPADMVEGKFLSRYPRKTKRFIWKFNQILSSSKIKAWHPDILHQTYYGFSPESLGEKVRIVTVYDMIHELFPSSFLKNDRTSLLKLNAINRADHIICISESTRRDLINLTGIDDKKVACIHLGVDAVINKFDLPLIPGYSTKPYLLFVGARTPYKNFIGLLEAFASSTRLSKDFDLYVLGGDVFANSELQKMSDLHLSLDSVIHVNADLEDLNAYYQHASAFIYPSLYEGFGLPPLEAMANGCPVVSSNAGPLPEVNGDAAEYFDPADRGAMIEAIENVVYSASRAKELQYLGYTRASNYSWGRCADQTYALYQRLL